MMNHFRFLSLSGIVASLIAMTSCADKTTVLPPVASPESVTSPVTTTPENMSKIDINNASDSDLKKLAIKLNIADLPEKIKENRPYKNVDDLAVKQVISPQQLDFIKTDITVAQVPENPENVEEKPE
ncbi:MAG: helix-hairpin-helix domain-containing protein [Microcoleaceae cyanobacterium MO_207.B10]|nr:helix-hairpin-helix domain-containing protein [Microcoleaceae cyanobacterium MO_207.B10]